MGMSLLSLPNELVEKVLLHVDAPLAICLTCKRFNELIGNNNSHYWKHRYVRMHGLPPSENQHFIRFGQSWKWLYLSRRQLVDSRDKNNGLGEKRLRTILRDYDGNIFYYLSLYRGQFTGDRLNGYGSVVYSIDCARERGMCVPGYYEGQFKDHMKHGYGIEYTGNNKVSRRYKGQWQMGEHHGIGQFTFLKDNFSCEGRWINDSVDPDAVFVGRYDNGDRFHFVWNGDYPHSNDKQFSIIDFTCSPNCKEPTYRAKTFACRWAVIPNSLVHSKDDHPMTLVKNSFFYANASSENISETEECNLFNKYVSLGFVGWTKKTKKRAKEWSKHNPNIFNFSYE